MKTTLTLALFCALLSSNPAVGQAPPPAPDALDDALLLVGLQRQDLGWVPKGWWPKFPGDIPYKLRAFDSLLEEPLDTVVYTRLLGNTARVHLDPATLDADAGRFTTHLYHAVHILGVNPKLGRFAN